MAHRILICSAGVGAGHGSAAAAIQSALMHLRPDAYVRHVDALSFSNSVFRRMYGRGYFDMIDVAPHLVRYIYDWLDRPAAGGMSFLDRFRSMFARGNLNRFVELLTREHWDLVINTHFLPPEIVAWLRKSGRVSFPQMTVTTDFDVHRLWVHSPCERYFTATEEGRINLASCGIPLQNITATGIPIAPIFSMDKAADECRKRHGIAGQHPVVLQLAGGGGYGPAESVHRALLKTPVPLEIVSVAGRNQELRKKLEAIPCPPHHRRIVLGFTDQMDELMAAADVIVSKPGGLSSSEALARGAAMVIVEPIPGQEDRNSDHLLENGAAIKVNNLASLPHKLGRLVTDPERLQGLRDAALQLSRPFAAFDIARAALNMIEPQQEQIVRQQAIPRASRLSRLSHRFRLRPWRRSGRRSSLVG